MDTPLQLFLQGIISEKFAEFSGLKDNAQLVIVVDNPRPRAPRSTKPIKSVMDASDHSNSRWSADTGDTNGQSPIPLPRPAPSPLLTALRKRKGKRNLMR